MGGLRWYRQDKDAVAARLRAGERPDMAAATAVGPLDELVALHEELGACAALEAAETARQRAGVAERLLRRTLAVLPFVGNAGLRGVADQLFREPAVLLRLGWSPVQVRQGDNGRHRHAAGRRVESLPCHPDTLRDALARIGEQAWLQAHQAAVAGLYRRGLVRGGVYAVDGTGLGAERRVVALVCVSGAHPVVVAWRSLEGAASEQGKAAVTRAAPRGSPAGAGGGGRGLHPPAAGRRAVRRRPAAGLAHVRQGDRRAGAPAGRPPARRGLAGAGRRPLPPLARAPLHPHRPGP
jgi:hypothetical protein